MPLPPILLGIAALAVGAIGASKLVAAKDQVEAAKERYGKARTSYDDVVGALETARAETSAGLDDLGKCRLQALQVLGDAVKFLRTAKVKERDLLVQMNLPIEQLDQWQSASVAAQEVLSGIAKAGAAGAATAAGAYALVGALASAGTGTAIATLGGAAAQSATLAWLGGGAIAAGGGGVAVGTAVMGGLVAGPAVAVAGFVASARAAEMENEIEREISKLQQDQGAKVLVIDKLKVSNARIEEIKASTTRVAHELTGLMSASDPSNDTDAHRVLKLACGLAKLLETRVLEDGGANNG
jgi:hypothetical protein